MKKIIILSALLFILTTGQILQAQNASVNGTTIGGNPSGIISKPCAIIIMPTDQEIKEMEKTNGSDNIETVNDNATISINIIKSYLDSTHAVVIEKEAKGELKFKLITGKVYTLPLDKLYWNVFLYNGENSPMKATVQDFSRQYINYMTIQK